MSKGFGPLTCLWATKGALSAFSIRRSDETCQAAAPHTLPAAFETQFSDQAKVSKEEEKAGQVSILDRLFSGIKYIIPTAGQQVATTVQSFGVVWLEREG